MSVILVLKCTLIFVVYISNRFLEYFGILLKFFIFICRSYHQFPTHHRFYFWILSIYIPLTIHDHPYKLFIVYVALGILLIRQQLFDLLIGKFFAQSCQKMSKLSR